MNEVDMMIVMYRSPELILKVVCLWLQLRVRIEVNAAQHA